MVPEGHNDNVKTSKPSKHSLEWLRPYKKTLPEWYRGKHAGRLVSIHHLWYCSRLATLWTSTFDLLQIQPEQNHPEKLHCGHTISEHLQSYVRTYLITNQSHSSIMWPGKANDWGISIIDQFNGPPPFIFDPNKYDTRGITRGQFLVGFIPTYQCDLQPKKKTLHDLNFPG